MVQKNLLEIDYSHKTPITMIDQFEKFSGNTIALDIIDEFTVDDQKRIENLFREKIEKGFDNVNLLIKLDDLHIKDVKIKAFMEDMIWMIRNFKHLGDLAIVAHSKILKALVPIDNFFFERLQKGHKERYFDISQLDEALKFVVDKELVEE